MTAEQRAELHTAISSIVSASATPADGSTNPPSVRTLVMSGGVSGAKITQVEVGIHADGPPLTTAQLLGLAVLLEDPAVFPQVLADYLLDQGHDYAAAVAEKARKAEREAIAERLYSEASHVLSRGPDPSDMHEFAAAALSSVADDLVFGNPPSSPTTSPPAD